MSIGFYMWISLKQGNSIFPRTKMPANQTARSFSSNISFLGNGIDWFINRNVGLSERYVRSFSNYVGANLRAVIIFSFCSKRFNKV